MSFLEDREAVRDSPLRAFSLFTVRAAIASARLSERAWCLAGEFHGTSAFLRDGNRVVHTYSTYGRGTDQVGTRDR